MDSSFYHHHHGLKFKSFWTQLTKSRWVTGLFIECVIYQQMMPLCFASSDQWMIRIRGKSWRRFCQGYSIVSSMLLLKGFTYRSIVTYIFSMSICMRLILINNLLVLWIPQSNSDTGVLQGWSEFKREKARQFCKLNFNI